MSKKKQRNIIIIGLSSIVLLMAIGYAAFSTVLNIQGTSKISSTWDIQITGITKDKTKGNVTEISEPTFDKESATFNVGLKSPGDYIYYKVAVKNKGTLAAIAKLGKLSCGDNNVIECGAYAEEAGIGQEIKSNTDLTPIRLIIGPGETEYYYIWAKYNDMVTEQPSKTSSSINLQLTYEQSDVGITHQTEDKCYTGKVLEDGTIALTDYNISCGTDIIIPETIDGYTVTKIADGKYDVNLGFISAFANKGITSVVLPNTLTYIGYAAFYHNQISSLIIPDSVKSIGTYSFDSNKISNLQLGSSVSLINAWAFSYNKLTSIKLPDSLNTIGTVAFLSNQLTSVDIPPSVTSIRGGAFNLNLFPENNAIIYARNSDGSTNNTIVVSYANSKFTSIPDNVTEIFEYAYYRTPIDTLNLPSNLLKIGAHAFSGSHIKQINFNDKITSIANNAFDLNDLANIDIPNSVTSIGANVFANNKLQTVTIGSGIKTIGTNAFKTSGSYNPITSITINRKEGSVSGSPWGATKAQINWTGTN